LEKKEPKTKMTFEKALGELERIAQRLESGEAGLEESLKEFEKGIELAKFCHDKLEEAERKIDILQKGTDGTIRGKGVRVKQETGEIEEDEEMQGSLL